MSKGFNLLKCAGSGFYREDFNFKSWKKKIKKKKQEKFFLFKKLNYKYLLSFYI